MTISEHTFLLEVSGEQLQVRRLRPEGLPPESSSPTLVFIHEALGSISQWRDFPETLVESTGLPALIYDRCGFGGSQQLEVSRGPDYLDYEVECLVTLLDLCTVRKPLLVGHSDGATLALLYAAAFPERPVAVISEAAHLFVEEVTLEGIRAAVKRWQTTDLRDRLMRYQGVHTDRVFSAWTETWLDPGFREWNIETQMQHIRCPVLALQGQTDEFGTALQLQAIAEKVGGPCRCRMIPACGHTPHRDARDEVLKEMTAFVVNLIRPT